MTYCTVVTVLALVGLTKKRFGHNAILKNLSRRSPRTFGVFEHHFQIRNQSAFFYIHRYFRFPCMTLSRVLFGICSSRFT